MSGSFLARTATVDSVQCSQVLNATHSQFRFIFRAQIHKFASEGLQFVQHITASVLRPSTAQCRTAAVDNGSKNTKTQDCAKKRVIM